GRRAPPCAIVRISVEGGSDRNGGLRSFNVSTSKAGRSGLTSARGHQRPQFIGAAVAYELAELDRPVAFGTEIVAPGQRAKRIAMQDVLDGETDRAVHLMGDAAAF